MTLRKWIYRAIGCGSIILLFLGGCGAANTTDTGTSGGLTPSPAVTATQALQGIPTYQPTPQKLTPTPNPTVKNVSSDTLTVSLMKTQYTAGEKITAMITNGLRSPVTAMDHQASCTILALQMLNNGHWTDVKQAQCQLMTPTREITLAAKSTFVQYLSPAGSSIHQSGWQPGQYRLMLRYTIDAPDKQRDTAIIYSPTFTIN